MKLFLLLCGLALVHAGCPCCNGTRPVIAGSRCDLVGYAVPLDKQCMLRGCEYDGQCLINERCRNGVCLNAFCMADNQCDGGQVCISNTCVNAFCDTTTQCPGDTICVFNQCVSRQCTVSAECGLFACIDGLCLPCDVDDQCAQGLICNAGACIDPNSNGLKACYRIGEVCAFNTLEGGRCCDDGFCHECCDSTLNFLCCNFEENHGADGCCDDDDCPDDLPVCLGPIGAFSDCVECIDDSTCPPGTQCGADEGYYHCFTP